MNIIETKKLTKFYGKVKGIENINLEVKEGEIFGFIGPNGAGKSTTIRTLLGLIYKTSGEAKIFGLDIIKDKEEILKNVGYLPSEVFYYDNMKVIDLLKYSASFYNKNCDKKIFELAKEFELDLNKKIEDLSYGNKKKVGIIQGLIHSPKLIILDEPTGGLDPLMQQKFFNIIKQENLNGATILFSSHILSEVQKLCDRVAIIKDGNLIKVENIKDMIRNSIKKVILDFENINDASDFNFEDSLNLEIKDSTVTFVYRGDVNKLVKFISKYNLADISIIEPDLEEIFMHYYQKED
jgi:ABC-2 type transport system ATP-binding protein